LIHMSFGSAATGAVFSLKTEDLMFVGFGS